MLTFAFSFGNLRFSGKPVFSFDLHPSAWTHGAEEELLQVRSSDDPRIRSTGGWQSCWWAFVWPAVAVRHSLTAACASLAGWGEVASVDGRPLCPCAEDTNLRRGAVMREDLWGDHLWSTIHKLRSLPWVEESTDF